MDQVKEIVEWASSLGGTSFAVIAIIGSYRGWWVPRWLYDKETARGDEWKTLYAQEHTVNEQHRAMCTLPSPQLR